MLTTPRIQILFCRCKIFASATTQTINNSREVRVDSRRVQSMRTSNTIRLRHRRPPLTSIFLITATSSRATKELNLRCPPSQLSTTRIHQTDTNRMDNHNHRRHNNSLSISSIAIHQTFQPVINISNTFPYTKTSRLLPNPV